MIWSHLFGIMENPLTGANLHPSPVTQVHESCVDRTEGVCIDPILSRHFSTFCKNKTSVCWNRWGKYFVSYQFRCLKLGCHSHLMHIYQKIMLKKQGILGTYCLAKNWVVLVPTDVTENRRMLCSRHLCWKGCQMLFLLQNCRIIKLEGTTRISKSNLSSEN